MRKSKAIPRSIWEERVKEYLASGKKQVEWCRENGVNINTFNAWFLKIKRELDVSKEKVYPQKIQSTKWISVEIDSKKEDCSKRSLFIKIGKATVEVPNDFDKRLLEDVTKVLVAIC